MEGSKKLSVDSVSWRINFENLKSWVSDAEADADKFFDRNNKSAGVRLRSKLSSISKLCKLSREDVLERSKLL